MTLGQRQSPAYPQKFRLKASESCSVCQTLTVEIPKSQNVLDGLGLWESQMPLLHSATKSVVFLRSASHHLICHKALETQLWLSGYFEYDKYWILKLWPSSDHLIIAMATNVAPLLPGHRVFLQHAAASFGRRQGPVAARSTGAPGGCGLRRGTDLVASKCSVDPFWRSVLEVSLISRSVSISICQCIPKWCFNLK